MGSNPIVASMSDERVGVSLDSEIIEGFNSIPVRPAYCRLWRFQMAIVFSLVVLFLSGLICYLLLIWGWYPGYPRLGPPAAWLTVIEGLSEFGIFILIISYVVAYFIIARGIYNWLYDGR